MRLGVVILLLVTCAPACSSADAEYGVPVEACGLVDPATVAALADGLTGTTPRQEPVRTLTDRVDVIECRHEFGGPDTVSIPPYDELAPDTPGTPAYRYTSVTAMRFHEVDDESGTDIARHFLASDPQEKVPNLAGLGLDDGDIGQRLNGVASYTRIRAVDANLVLVIDYGGANSDAKPAGLPADVRRAGALRLLADAAARLPCPEPDC
ncbi:hypothetical protein GCM10009634_33760 [Saccharothrix xinjiangensis]